MKTIKDLKTALAAGTTWHLNNGQDTLVRRVGKLQTKSVMFLDATGREIWLDLPKRSEVIFSCYGFIVKDYYGRSLHYIQDSKIEEYNKNFSRIDVDQRETPLPIQKHNRVGVLRWIESRKPSRETLIAKLDECFEAMSRSDKELDKRTAASGHAKQRFVTFAIAAHRKLVQS